MDIVFVLGVALLWSAIALMVSGLEWLNQATKEQS